MPPITGAGFAALLRKLGRDEFEAFVVDLLEARGRRVTTDGGYLIVVDDSRAERVLRVDHRPRIPGLPTLREALGTPTRPAGDRDVDAVVTNRRSVAAAETVDDADVDVIDADDLRRQALYSIDRSACDDLFRTYFGRPLGAFASGPEGGRRALRDALPGAAFGTTGLRSSRPLVFIVLTSLLLVVALAGTPFVAGPADIGSSGGAALTSPVSLTPTPAPTASVGRPPTAELQGDSFPPGLSSDGLTDAKTLARAHAEALSNRSYTWTITFSKRANGETRRRETVREESPTVYVSEVDGSPPTGDLIDPVANVSSYADGTVRYEKSRRNGRTRYRARPVPESVDGYGRFRERATRYLEWLLPSRETAIVERFERDGRSFYTVTGVGDPVLRGESVRMTAVVDSSGVVHRLSRVYHGPEYGPQRHAITIAISLRYEAIGNTTVDPPTWYGQARNATDTSTG